MKERSGDLWELQQQKFLNLLSWHYLEGDLLHMTWYLCLCQFGAYLEEPLVTSLLRGKGHVAKPQSLGAFLCTGGPFQSMRIIQAATLRGATSPWRKKGLLKLTCLSYVIFGKGSAISLALSHSKHHYILSIPNNLF